MEAIKHLNPYEKLVAFGIKPSVQRMAIMKYLMEHRTHPTVDEVYIALSPEMPTLSKTTVYNTLKLFAEQGAALMLTIDDRNLHFDADTAPHAHFICQECSEIYDLPYPAMKEKESSFVDGHEIKEEHYYYRGLCKKCLKKKHINNN